jgi:uncharacterized protein VirK/YbjX
VTVKQEPCVALVHWEDAMMEGHWQDNLPNPTDDLSVYTCGFLLYEDDSRLVLVQSLQGYGYTGNHIHIPKGMIRKITRVPLI